MKIAFVFNSGRLSRITSARKGLAPREFFLGALELEEKGHMIGYFEIDVDRVEGAMQILANRVFNKRILPEKTYASLLLRIHKFLQDLNRFDCVVATTSGIAFALGIWQKLRLLKIPIVAIHCGLANNPVKGLKRHLTDVLIRSMHTVLYGEGERDLLLNLYPGIDELVAVNQFGVDTEFWTPGNNEEEYILSVGNDGRRDYQSLVLAAESIPYQVKIVTSLPLPERLPDNVTHLRGSWHTEIISDKDLRSLYQRAMCVVIPLKETVQPSGQSVCLQAMACGKPVVLTKTIGLWSSAMMKDRYNVLFVRPGDIDDLSAKVNILYKDSSLRKQIGMEARNTVSIMSTMKAFAQGLETYCQSAVRQTFPGHNQTDSIKA